MCSFYVSKSLIHEYLLHTHRNASVGSGKQLLWRLGWQRICLQRRTGFSPGSGRSPGKGNGHRLQGSCRQNSVNRGAWRPTAHGFTNIRSARKSFPTSPLPPSLEEPPFAVCFILSYLSLDLPNVEKGVAHLFISLFYFLTKGYMLVATRALVVMYLKSCDQWSASFTASPRVVWPRHSSLIPPLLEFIPAPPNYSDNQLQRWAGKKKQY